MEEEGGVRTYEQEVGIFCQIFSELRALLGGARNFETWRVFFQQQN